MARRCCIANPVSLLATMALSGSALADAPSFTGVGTLPGEYGTSNAAGVSDDGLTVIGSTTTDHEPTVTRAFRWTAAGGMVDLGDLPGGPERASAFAASADGSVIVGESYYAQYLVEPFRWTAEAGLVPLGFLPGGDHASALGVSSDGSLVVGWSDSQMGNQAFLRDADGSMVALGALEGQESEAHAVSDDGAVIVGASYSTDDFHGKAVVWTARGSVLNPLPDLPGATDDGGASDCSADGSVIVGYGATPQGTRACRWTFNGQTWDVEPLGELPGVPNSRASAVSRDGSTIVGMTGSLEGMFIWDAHLGMRDLKVMLVEEYGLTALEGWKNTVATGISGDGRTFTGYGYDPFGQFQGWAASLGSACYPDFTGDGALDLFDFLGYVNAFNSADPSADCTADGIFDLFDFLCFVNAFNAGC